MLRDRYSYSLSYKKQRTRVIIGITVISLHFEIHQSQFQQSRVTVLFLLKN